MNDENFDFSLTLFGIIKFEKIKKIILIIIIIITIIIKC